MQHDAPVDVGARVKARDGDLGTVLDILNHPNAGGKLCFLVQLARTGEQILVPVDAVESAPNRHEVRLAITTDQAYQQDEAGATNTRGDGTTQMASPTANGPQQLRTPIVEERLKVTTEPVDLGEVRVHKRVENVEEVLRHSLTRQGVEIERTKVDRFLDKPQKPRHEGDWLVLPVMEEVLVVERRLRLIEEVRVRSTQVTEQSQQREIRRRERIDVEDATKHSGLLHTNGGKELAEDKARVATHSGGMQAPKV